MATKLMLRDGTDLMTCDHCHKPVILTVDSGLCPRCFYKLECEAICAAAEDEVDRVLSDSGPIAVERPGEDAPAPAPVPCPQAFSADRRFHAIR